MIGLAFGTKQLRLAWLYDNYVSLMTAAIVLSFLVSVLVYLSSFRMGRLLSKSGHTGCEIARISCFVVRCSSTAGLDHIYCPAEL